MGPVLAALLLASPAHATPLPATVQSEWKPYVAAFIQGDGRVIDRAGDDVSTSEGQAFALLRAAWCDDRATFDKVLHWTLNNLQGTDPLRLPGWKWGRKDDGSWGLLDPNAASDADQWMSYALLMAAGRWHEPKYQEQALGLLKRVWDQETAQAGPRRVILPGPWEAGKDTLRLNPSYWLPFAWRAFAKADPAHPWAGLVDDAYFLWEACRSPSGLPPDWCWVDRASGRVLPPPIGETEHASFGFEAFRIGWTLAADLRWYGDERARRALEPFGLLADRWKVEKKIPAVILPDGTPRQPWGYLGMYGALLPAWAQVRPGDVDQLFDAELRASDDPAVARDYYAHNWVWFGLALWSGLAAPPEGP
jgi:endoglucanase